MSIFSGIWIPLVTPFDGGFVDHASLDRLVRYYAGAGVSGFVALGTTGEPAALSDAEQSAVLATVIAAAGPVPVVAGVSGNNTLSLCEKVEVLNDKPIAGILAAAPYYIRPSQAGVIGYFEALADKCRAPVILYDIPARTGVRLELPTLLELAGHERIVAVKDCGGELNKTLELILDGRLQILCGEDIEMFGALCAGASGAITASAHILPERFVAMARAIKEDRLADARVLWHALVPLVFAAFAEPNPGPVKGALARCGLIRNELRPPMMPAGIELMQTWDAMLKASGQRELFRSSGDVPMR